LNGSDDEKGIVQIMTIHKAKGLEFDTVLVPGLGRKTMNDSEKLLLWSERTSKKGEPYLILAPIQSIGGEDPIYDYLKKQNKKAAHLEAVRLLYVAATRAKRRLYLFTQNEQSIVIPA
jgi:ATP-dependent exoDNAse (exonuclease V) beta subunit